MSLNSKQGRLACCLGLVDREEVGNLHCPSRSQGWAVYQASWLLVRKPGGRSWGGVGARLKRERHMASKPSLFGGFRLLTVAAPSSSCQQVAHEPRAATRLLRWQQTRQAGLSRVEVAKASKTPGPSPASHEWLRLTPPPGGGQSRQAELKRLIMFCRRRPYFPRTSKQM